ncbi:pilus assembly protein PilZ [Colwellia sp. Arc7-635]|uniref:PilZ domain-containing protein n=1 Tax=Colwellia sp. Arc7-635 TaxID=2497879 RepID=UPI000F85998D|nr:PilZ domain-containing protein [Colwellia sp. Arc7-635]AZQ84670.1 pilus assembly protein PilZ [Colwellia sp. Arc7-635]
MENISLEFISDRDLYQSYMPFMKNGGLFIRTTEQLALGTEVNLIVTLPDSLESSQVKGTVSWITPVGAQNGTPAGIGVSFVEDPDNIRNQIDKSIGRLLNSPEPTLSM